MNKSLKEKFECRFIPEPNSGCWLWIGPIDGHYGRICYVGTHKRFQLAHRAAWELYRGEIPDGICVCHHCDTPLCVNPEHLFLGTHADNHRDMCAKGRNNAPRGANHPSAKLTEKQVREIRDTIGSHAATARQFRVDPSTVSRIRSNEKWRHL